MPELSDSLHELYDAEASVQVIPARGMNTLAGAARSARRRAMLRAGAIFGAVVIAAGGVTAGALSLLTPTAVTPGTTPTATASGIQGHNVTWAPEEAAREALAGVTIPACGDAFAPDPVAVDGIEPVVSQTDAVEASVGMPFAANFTAPQKRTFLANPGTWVLTQDGKVVALEETPPYENIDLYTSGTPSYQLLLVMGYRTCAAQAAIAALYEAEGYAQDQDLTDSEWAEFQPKLNEVLAQFASLPAGTYTIYSVSPVLFGEQLAVAQAIKDAGVAQVGAIASDLGSTPFADDPRLQPYCFDDGNAVTCNAPQSVVDDVLTFPVDPSLVDATPSGVAVSEGLEFTVP